MLVGEGSKGRYGLSCVLYSLAKLSPFGELPVLFTLSKKRPAPATGRSPVGQASRQLAKAPAGEPVECYIVSPTLQKRHVFRFRGVSLDFFAFEQKQ